jgi:class 3 adenylate cyclase/tetratricopeptide (TPR) repeat protein
VSVLFADLVGFTSLSERADPEEVRELMGTYYDRCRSLIERFGGVVEKFIGDAVMAVWGSPVAREDDAERAVRAALALTSAVTRLGEEVGMPQLRVRAGVLTGYAAVDVGAEHEGMVLGDTVNTAARLQSIAAPGGVLVDDVTRRSSEAAIAYEDAGEHALKGREAPVRAWAALRVVAGAGGARRSAGLEAPLVGRDRELAALIEASDASARDRRASLIAVAGEAGAGKSRLLWEYFKHLDGIDEQRFWHQGRCLSYGEGVAYWALAEMVRTRAGIAEDEPAASARNKLSQVVAAYVPSERERRLIEPRLGHLLRLEDRAEADRADLFSGWRLFFERMADRDPVILAFEDLQWADSGLLEFIDYLLEWSAEHPIFVIALGRTELRTRRPHWNALVLGPLAPLEVSELLEGLVPGLPEALVTEISARAEGIPLYAVETVRMLKDRGLLVADGQRYTVTGDVSELAVPETLQALVASRLDGLSREERALVQDASVLGQSFAPAAVAALVGRPEADVLPALDGLVAKQVLARDDDPRSPERGQYAFLQTLLRTVAYGTLARRTRKAKHLAAARYLRSSWPGELIDIAEVLAAHDLAAIRADPGAEDVTELRASAREALSAAGRAAASLALGPEADRYLVQAAELARDDDERAELLSLAGLALWRGNDSESASARLGEALSLRAAAGHSTGGQAAVTLATVARMAGRLEEARALLAPFRDATDPTDSPILSAEALADLAIVHVFLGDPGPAGPLFDTALTTLELNEAWPSLAQVLASRGVFLNYSQRRQEGMAVTRQALSLALAHDLPGVAVRAYYNLAGFLLETDHLAQALTEVDNGLALARERGDRAWESMLRAQSIPPLALLGRWDAAQRTLEGLLGKEANNRLFAAEFGAMIASARGDRSLLARCVEVAEQYRDSAHLEMRAAALATTADMCALDAPARALALARPVLDFAAVAKETVGHAYWVCVEAALAAGEAMDELAAWVEALPPARAGVVMQAGRARLRAELAHCSGRAAEVERCEREAVRVLSAAGMRPLMFGPLLDQVRRRRDPIARAQARELAEQLGAPRWLARLEAVERVAARPGQRLSAPRAETPPTAR